LLDLGEMFFIFEIKSREEAEEEEEKIKRKR
jgi:hypothetical protein